MKMQLMNETLRYDVYTMKLYKKKLLLKQNYLFIRNLQFQKFIKTSPSVLQGCRTRTKLICSYAPQPTSFPNHHTVVGETPHSTHNTLANSN